VADMGQLGASDEESVVPVEPAPQGRSPLRTLGLGALLVAVGEGLLSLIQYAGGVLIGRGMGAAALGEFGLYLLVARMTDTLGRGGLPVTNIRFVAQYLAVGDVAAARTTVKLTTVLAIITGLAAGVGLWAVSPVVATHFYHRPELTTGFRIAACMVPLTAIMLTMLAVPQAAKNAVPLVAISRVGVPLLGLAGTAVIVALRGTVLQLVWVQAGALALGTAVAALVMVRLMPTGPSSADTGAKLRAILRFSVVMCAKAVSRFLLFSLDVIILGHFVDKVQLGVYFAASRTALFIPFPRRAVQPLYMPVVSEQYARKDLAGMERAYAVTRRWTTGPALALFGAMVIAPAAIMRINGAEFTTGGAVLAILGVAALAEASLGGSNEVLIMTGGQKLATVTEWAALALMVATLPPLASRWGIMGGALSVLLTQGGVNLARQLWLTKHVGFHQFDRQFVKALIPSVGLIAALAYAGVWFGDNAASNAIRLSIFGVLFLAILAWGWLPELRRGAGLRLPNRQLLGASEGATEQGGGPESGDDGTV